MWPAKGKHTLIFLKLTNYKEEMIFKSQSTQPLVKAVRETFDQFDLELQVTFDL